MCSCYVYDVLQSPYPSTAPASALIRQDRIKHLFPVLVPEVIRLIKVNRKNPGTTYHCTLICLEAGLARRTRINQTLICQHWFAEKIRIIGDLNQLHFHHTGGYCPDLDK
jgi:hypothetical protein